MAQLVPRSRTCPLTGAVARQVDQLCREAVADPTPARTYAALLACDQLAYLRGDRDPVDPGVGYRAPG